MSPLRWAVLAAVLFAADAAVAQDELAQHERFWAAVDRNSTIRPCARGAAEMTAAQDALRQFRSLLLTLPGGADVAAPLSRLHELLQLPCFKVAFESARVFSPDSTIALKAWYASGGGLWLESLLELPELGTRSDLRPHVVLPPDPRMTLAPGRPGHPSDLDRWLCAPTDARCGARTRGWTARAATALETKWRASRSPDSFDARVSDAPNAKEVAARCVIEAEGDDSGARYEAWRSCLEQARSWRPLPPHAEFKMPVDGWLIVSGRRGHYEFCDTVHAFNLETGEAILDESCSALALERDGSVNRAETNAGRRLRVRTGRVSVDNLREAAWMLLFRSQFKEVQVDSEAFPLPAGWERSWQAKFTPWHFTMRGQTMTGNTGQSRLTWTLSVPGRALLAGRVTFPMSYDGAEDHAMDLVSVAEQSLVESCVRARPPSIATTRVAVLDEIVPDSAVTEHADGLREASARWSALAPCR